VLGLIDEPFDRIADLRLVPHWAADLELRVAHRAAAFDPYQRPPPNPRADCKLVVIATNVAGPAFRIAQRQEQGTPLRLPPRSEAEKQSDQARQLVA
jgi:hypothetical protein